MSYLDSNKNNDILGTSVPDRNKNSNKDHGSCEEVWISYVLQTIYLFTDLDFH